MCDSRFASHGSSYASQSAIGREVLVGDVQAVLREPRVEAGEIGQLVDGRAPSREVFGARRLGPVAVADQEVSAGAEEFGEARERGRESAVRVRGAHARDDLEGVYFEPDIGGRGFVEDNVGIGSASRRFGAGDRDLLRRPVDADRRATGALDGAQEQLTSAATDVEDPVVLRQRAPADEAVEHGTRDRVPDRDAGVRDCRRAVAVHLRELRVDPAVRAPVRSRSWR